MLSLTTYLPLLSCLINLFLFAYVTGQRRKNRLNGSYMAFSFAIAATCLGDYLMRLLVPYGLGPLIAHIVLSIMLILGFFYINFIYALINRKSDIFLRIITYSVSVIALGPLLFRNHFLIVEQTHGRYNFQPTLFLIPVFIVCIILPGAYALLLLARRMIVNDTTLSRKQISLVFWGSVFSLLYEALIFVVLPLFFSYNDLLPFSSVGIVVHSVFIYWSIHRYNLFTVDIEQIQRVALHIFENISEAVLLFDKNGNVLQENQSAALMFKEAGKTITPSLLEQCLADYSYEKEYVNFQTSCICRDKTYTVMLSQSLIKQTDRVLAKIIMIRDISEQVRIERELHRIHRVESIGVLAGGIAHDFNNCLSGVYSAFGLLKMSGTLSHENEIIVKEGEAAVHQASLLTRQLLTFSKGDAPDIGVQAVGPLLEGVLAFTLRGTKARYRLNIPETLWHISADKGQIGQVIQNLALNADQAMPEGGWITVVAENRTVTTSDSVTLFPGQYVRLSFIDDGVGIPNSIIDKIFDPYFTTKPKGNGLGLAIVHSIINKHGGHIEVHSQPGKGSTFHVYLKASITPAKEKPETVPEQFHGSGKILVMDDDPVIRLLLSRVLATFGFTVEVAENGESALSLYDLSIKRQESYTAVIADLTIPGAMGGKVLGEKLLQQDPHLKIIIASGYSQDPILVNFQNYGFHASIRKPYTIDELKMVLTKVLKS
ncbi:MAG: response regulator [Chitinispirillaceae bacterium]|nr:response regulator [Chitinispirillaceae bacterium]